MITLRKSAERGHFRADWLDSRHSFSFDTYHDPAHMGFRTLRVINEDRVAPGAGFPLHPHRDMEIVTFILAGALEHRDDLGHREIIHAGEVQRITAGTGIRHSEANPSATAEVHLLQIWLLPEEKGLAPSYETRRFDALDGNSLRLLASRDGRGGSAVIHQDVSLYAGALAAGSRLEHLLLPGRHAWLQVTGGELTLNGIPLAAGDGAAASAESELELAAFSETAFLLFDLA
ncbi:MAG TPA: pirin family protein [Desulfuromonadales bacterium]|nr:pirin family protein [Desulfuromonadales bacterium]